MERAVLTIATNKPIYIMLAINLARSFKWWHKDSDIRFVLATDQKQLIPPDLQDIEVIELQPGQYGQGFSPKLHLDKLALAQQTLFIDADCLCVGSLEPAFERFTGHAVSVVGKMISQGDWFGDVTNILSQFNLSSMPRFNGGIYYLEKGETSQQIYETARSLESKYDEIGFKRLRGKPNDEVLMSLAMAIHEQLPIPEDGTIMNSTLAAPGGVEIDIFSGQSKLKNPCSHANHNSWYELEEMNPVLVHFLSSETEKLPYIYEVEKLRLIVASNYPVFLAGFWSYVTISFPMIIREKFKDILRPIYRKLFGFKAVKASLR